MMTTNKTKEKLPHQQQRVQWMSSAQQGREKGVGGGGEKQTDRQTDTNTSEKKTKRRRR